MKKFISIVSVIFFFVGIGNAQNVGINATGAAPDNSSMLDVSSTNSGMLIPRMTQAQRNAIGGPATGLIIYQTNANPGFYYWDGAQWVRLFGGDAWQLDGNAGTNPTNNFVGTTDNQALRIRTNNANRFEFATDGRLRSFNSGSAGAPTYSWTTDTDIGMYRIGANVLGFSTAGTERMIVNAAGQVLVNTNVPTDPNLFEATVDAGNNWSVNGYNTTANGGSATFYNTNAANGFNTMEVVSNANNFNGYFLQLSPFNTRVALASTTTAGNNRWGVYSDDEVLALNYFVISDERLKTNIDEISSTLDKIKLLRPVQYNFNNSEYSSFGTEQILQFGFLASEVHSVFPNIVAENSVFDPNEIPRDQRGSLSGVEGKFSSVNYTGLIPILTKAIQEQQEQIESLEQRIERLEKLIEEK